MAWGEEANLLYRLVEHLELAVGKESSAVIGVCLQKYLDVCQACTVPSWPKMVLVMLVLERRRYRLKS